MTTGRLSCLVLAMLAGSCAVGPDYASPKVSVPSTYSGSFGEGAVDPGDWWTMMGDPILNVLVDQARGENLDLQQAASRVRQARLQEGIVRGGGGPRVNADAQASRTRLSENAVAGLLSDFGGVGEPGAGLGAPGASFSTYQAGFDSSWEPDLFGGRRRAEEAGRARTEAAEWSRRDAEVVLTAEVVRRYQLYRADERRLALLDEMIAGQGELIAIVRAQTEAGLISQANDLQQQRDLEELAARREALKADAATHLHALAMLLGASQAGLAAVLAGGEGVEVADPVVPAGLPAELLQRRPDIRAAERRLAAATADIGVATADLYPRISLTGTLQLVSRSLAMLAEADSLQASGAVGVSLPLMDRGVRRSTVRLREARTQEAELTYRQSVRTAVRDVEDALSRLEADRNRAARLSAAAISAAEAVEIARVRHRNGLTSFVEVIDARRTSIVAHDQLAQARAAVLIDAAALSKALGGGWSDPLQHQNEDGARGQDR